jgi:Ca-activated chloride channel family protein
MLLASIGVLAIASARPQTTRDAPIGRTSIILALDVSQSMCATDVDPNRMSAAQEAARDFAANQPKGTRMGLVIFSGFAQLAVSPTTDRKELVRVIDGLTTARGTAIGAALLKSLDAVAEVNADVRPVGDADGGGLATEPPAASESGAFVPDIVVLLTDGANTRGIAPLDAVPYAVARRVRVYTIGFGTTEPTGLACSAEQLGADTQVGGRGFGGGGFGGGFGGGRSPLQADHETLRQIAERTGGVAYSAEDGAQLGEVFAQLPRDVTLQKERREVTALFVGLGAVLAAAAIGASIRWSAYP